MRKLSFLLLIFIISITVFAAGKTNTINKGKNSEGSYEYYLEIVSKGSKADFAYFVASRYNELKSKSNDFYTEKQINPGFISYSIKKYFDVDIDAKINDGYSEGMTREDTLVFSIFKNGFSIGYDERKLTRGDICFSRNRTVNGKTGIPFIFNEQKNTFPQDSYIFLEWINNGKNGDAVVANGLGITKINVFDERKNDAEWVYFHYDKNSIAAAKEIIERYDEIEEEREQEVLRKKIEAVIKENEEKQKRSLKKEKELITVSAVKIETKESDKSVSVNKTKAEPLEKYRFEAEFGIDMYSWKEYILNENKEKEVVSEEGPMSKVLLKISYDYSPKIKVSLFGNVEIAALNYNGQTQDGWPLATRTDVFGGGVGATFRWEIISIEKIGTKADIYINAGTTGWSRNIASNTVTEPGNPANTQVTSGYIEKYNIIMAGFGGSVRRKINRGTWFIEGGADIPLRIKERVEFSKLGYSDFTLEPKGDISPLANIGYIFDKGFIIKWHIRSLYLRPSKLVEVSDGASYGQPKSIRINTGLVIGYTFK